MLNYLVSSSYILNLLYSFIGLIIYKYELEDIKSQISIIHSSIIYLSCWLFINEYIDKAYLIQNFHILIGYFLYDIIYQIGTNNKKEFFIRSCHHIIGLGGINLFINNNNLEIIISKLFLTELVNIPLEIRYMSIRHNYYPKVTKLICSIIIYYLFLTTRIINPYYDYIIVYNYNDKLAIVTFTAIYILWIYWFILVNIKSYKMIKYFMS